MSCHTWCYAHIPEKNDDWSRELHDIADIKIREKLQFLNSKDWEKVYTNPKYLEVKEQLKETYENILSIMHWNTSPGEFARVLSKHPDMISYLQFTQDYGLYVVRGGKIYRDTCMYYGPGFMERPLFDKQFHNPFRIYDYNAESCWSLEETMERCREYQVDWMDTYEDGMLKNDLEQVEDFWRTYPEGMISFG